jgi:hypothetical protein
MKLNASKGRILPFLWYRLKVVPGQTVLFVLYFLCSKTFNPVDCYGIQVVCEPSQRDRLPDIINALELIRRTDCRRFSRIQRFVKRIMLFRIRKRGVYYVVGRICAIRPVSQARSNTNGVTHFYASILIHEATHGLLESRMLPYSQRNREQIERICFAEQTRFLSKSPNVLQDLHALLVDEKRMNH